MKLTIKINKRFILLMHFVAWAIIFSLPYIFSSEFSSEKDKDELAFQKIDTITNFLWMGLFYLNVLILMPQLFYKKKYVLYILALVFSFFLIMLIHGALFEPFVPGRDFNFFRSSGHNIIPFLFTVLVSMVYTMVADKIKTDISAIRVKHENLKTELSFLRSQISPHFLFNVLNNIVALVRMKSNDLEPTIMKLSSLMQYMLYETDEEKVVVKSEADYLKAYIDLQKQRFGNELTLQVVFDIKEEWQTIEPMLLIPFVENAFKHGGMLQRPEMHVCLSVINNELRFTVKNKFEESKAIKDKTSGIGLRNVNRRLELLYPGKHVLKVDKQPDWFTINLQITLK
jgi:two-component system, LytTR family, sensor kinase